jgi:UDP-N-acetylglucosamine 2-epimerase (non-hydrolysing)
MIPIWLELKKRDIPVSVCLTGQHDEMLHQVLDFFGVEADRYLGVMRQGQDLNELSAKIISGVSAFLLEFKPKIVLVHGDTASSFFSAIAAFHLGLDVGHVEAGLRTFNLASPFPEEAYRQLTSRISTFHFSPTIQARKNLVSEGIKAESIFMVGNTVIDALKKSVLLLKSYNSDFSERVNVKLAEKPIILVTFHRRENLNRLQELIDSIKELSIQNQTLIVWPVHKNPLVSDAVNSQLGHKQNVILTEPLTYPDFVWIMSKSFIVLTDSGGVQEEAPSLGIPVLVMRDTTERPEGIKSGNAKLIGCNRNSILTEINSLLKHDSYYRSFSKVANPYGDGFSSQKIIQTLIEEYNVANP